MKKIIYICGVDGVGKTSIAHKLVANLKENGYAAIYKWMRFNHFFVKPVNMLGRLCGLSVKENYADGTVVGYHYYFRSRIFTLMYLVATKIDFFIAYLIKLKLPLMLDQKRIIVVDRFLYDTMIDMYIATKRDTLISSESINSLEKRYLRNTQVIQLVVEKNTLYERRPDVPHDENFDERYRLYKDIADYSKNMNIVDNNDSLENALSEVIRQAVGA